MGRRTRLLVLILAALSLSASAPSPRDRNNAPNDRSGTEINDANPTAPTAPQEPVESPFYKQPCGNPSHDRESDLCAQWEAADAAGRAATWSMWGTLVALGGTLALLVQIYLTRQAVEETVEATRAMRQANEIAREDRRPIIVFSHLEWEQFSPRMPEAFLAHFIWANVGKRPARLIRLEIERRQIPMMEKPDYSAMWTQFAVAQKDPSGLIIMPQTPHRSVGVLVDRLDYQLPHKEERFDVYLLARATYVNAIAGEHDRDFSTQIVIKVLPMLQFTIRPDMPDHMKEALKNPLPLVSGPLNGEIVGYQAANFDDVDAVQMT